MGNVGLRSTDPPFGSEQAKNVVRVVHHRGGMEPTARRQIVCQEATQF